MKTIGRLIDELKKYAPVLWAVIAAIWLLNKEYQYAVFSMLLAYSIYDRLKLEDEIKELKEEHKTRITQ